MTNGCAKKNKKWCVSCNSNNHSSWDRDCLTLARKIEEFDQRNLENSLAFFPIAEPWTWAPVPNAITCKPSQRAEELKWKNNVLVAYKSGFQPQLNFEKAPAPHDNNNNHGTRPNCTRLQSRVTPRENNEAHPQTQGNSWRGTPAPSQKSAPSTLLRHTKTK